MVGKSKERRLFTFDVSTLQTEELFGVLSGEDIGCEEILPACDMRQAADQIFDIAKNHTKLLPLRIWRDGM